jgi:hypothetical protein
VGASYEFVDESSAPGFAYSYWLEAIDVFGNSTEYGPVSVEIPSPVSRMTFFRPRQGFVQIGILPAEPLPSPGPVRLPRN